MRTAFLLSLALSTSACAAVIDLGPERQEGGDGVGGATGAGGGNGGGGGAVASTGQGGGGGVADDRVWCDGSRVLWVKQFGDSAPQRSESIAPDGAGGVFIAGQFAGELDLGGPASFISQGFNEMFLARLDADGHHVWSRQLGDAGWTSNGVLLVSPTPDGGVLLSGEFRGPAKFGDDDVVETPNVFADGFVARYDALGNHLWHRIITGANPNSSEVCRAVAGPDGSVSVGVTFVGTIEDFDNEAVTSAGAKDLLVVKLDAGGMPKWSHHYGDIGDEFANAIAVDGFGRVVLGVGSTATLDLGTGPLLGGAEYDALVGVYEPMNGDAIWTERYGGLGGQNVTLVTVAAGSNHVLVTGGLTFGSVDFGGGPVGTVAHGGYIARLGANGEHFYSISVEDFENATSLVVDPQGNVLTTGWFDETLKFGGEPIETLGKQDGIIAKLDPTLDLIWTLQVGSTKDDTVSGVAVDAQSNALVLAEFQDSVSLPGCPTFTSKGGSDLLLIRLAP